MKYSLCFNTFMLSALPINCCTSIPINQEFNHLIFFKTTLVLELLLCYIAITNLIESVRNISFNESNQKISVGLQVNYNCLNCLQNHVSAASSSFLYCMFGILNVFPYSRIHCFIKYTLFLSCPLLSNIKHYHIASCQ